jgi:hypothetical protein
MTKRWTHANLPAGIAPEAAVVKAPCEVFRVHVADVEPRRVFVDRERRWCGWIASTAA